MKVLILFSENISLNLNVLTYLFQHYEIGPANSSDKCLWQGSTVEKTFLKQPP